MEEIKYTKEEQELHRQQMKAQREAIKKRMEQYHRLARRGQMAEAAIDGAIQMSDEQFQEILLLEFQRK